MPKRIADNDDEMPRRRRRGAQAVAIEPEEERGLVMRLLLHSPKDMVAGTLAAAAVVAIIINALFLQAGHHPSPMFGSVVVLPPPAPATPAPTASVASPLPRPRPAEATARPVESQQAEAKPTEPVKIAEPRPSESRTSEARTSEPKTMESKASEKASDPMTNLVVKSTSTSSNVMRPPASIPTRETTQSAASRRIAAVQRALTEYGYGQLKPTGTIGADTQAAIARFERDRKLPVTSQVSERMVRELSAMIGHPID